MSIQPGEWRKPDPEWLKGPHRTIELKAAISEPVDVKSLVEWDQVCRLRGYPKTLQVLEPSISALVNYGHKVKVVPERVAVDEARAALVAAFAPGWDKDIKGASPELLGKLGVLSGALLDTMAYLRGELKHEEPQKTKPAA